MPSLITPQLKQHAVMLLAFVAICWLVLAVDAILPGSFGVFGVQPRVVHGLRGIPVAPFLHGNVAHLTANTVPLLVLGGLVLLANARRFLSITLWTVLGAGLGAWLFGAPQSVHIGASGVVFGYLGFLLSHGWFAKRVALILLSLFVAGVWGGLVFGVLPGQEGVSWQSHAGGFVGGVLAARSLSKGPTQKRASARPRTAR